MTGAQDFTQGQRTDATVSPWDSLRDCLAKMSQADIPIWEQNDMVAKELRYLAARAVSYQEMRRLK